MKYAISDLIDIPRLQQLMEAFHRSTGIVHALMDTECNLLTAAGWEDACTKFHRACPISLRRCVESNDELNRRIWDAPFVGYQCPNGLMDYAARVMIEGEHLATIFVGQIFHEPPDLDAFRRQAEECGFDEAAYLEAIRKIPVVPVEKMEGIMAFQVALAGMLAAMGVSRLRQLEAEAKAHSADEATLRALLQTMPDLVWMKDVEGNYLISNPTFQRFVGKPEREIEGKTDYDLVARELADSFRHNDRLALEAGGPRQNDEWLTFAEGGYRGLFETVKAPVRDQSGKTIGVLGIAHDITERHRRAEMDRKLAHAEKMEALGRLAGSIAHDFNNMLAGIEGFAYLIAEDAPEGSVARQRAERILSASGRGKNLIRRIQFFSRKAEPSSIEKFRLGDVAAEAHGLLMAMFPATTAIDAPAAFDLPGDEVVGDRTQLLQGIINLAVNANDALDGKPGTVTIRLHSTVSGPAAERVRQAASSDFFETWSDGRTGFTATGMVAPTARVIALTVADTGCGMPPDVMKEVFTPFFTTKDITKGTGLGLASVQRTVLAHGGAILVESIPGEGSAFTLVLPMATEATAETGTAEPAAQRDTRRPAPYMRVIVVDDEEDFRVVLREKLARMNIDARVCASPEEALRLVASREARWDALITDQTMPRMTGLDLIRALRAEGVMIPCILCSGYSADDLESARTEEPGIVAVLHKPFEFDLLVDALSRCKR